MVQYHQFCFHFTAPTAQRRASSTAPQMANDKIERQLQHLKTLQAAGRSGPALKEVRAALNDRVNVVVAKAAALAGEWQEQELLPDLLKAYARLYEKTPGSDPQCWGKSALAKALKNLGCSDSAVFLRGVNYHQWEAVWGGSSDTAALLRGTCALALVQCTDILRDDILAHLVNALTDTEPSVRADAARALEQIGGRDVSLLLRLKARAGDKEVRVTGQILESLLQTEAASGVPFVIQFLEDVNPEVREEGALALGTSRLPEALDALLQAFESGRKLRPGGDEVLLRAISASRLDRALDFLLNQVRTARPRLAEEALHALALHRDSEQIVNRVAEAIAGREELRAIFERSFSKP